MHIDGRTAVLVHLSYPSAHLRTPQLFNARVVERGLNAVLVPWQVHPDHLSETVAALRGAESVSGLLVTIPHKEAAAPLCDQLEGVARSLTAVNVIRRDADGTLTGRNLDGIGFVHGLLAAEVGIEGRRAIVAGAGGVALAIGAALVEAGVSSVSVTNRTQARAEAMIEKLAALANAKGRRAEFTLAGSADPSGFDIVVNATSLGMHASDALPFPVEALRPGMTVAEAVMVPRITPLLDAAARRGARIVPGEAMLADQIDPFIDFILGPIGPEAERS